MKKQISIIVSVMFFFISGSSQTPFCAGIITSDYPKNPQFGLYDYFGVRVKLDMVYDQNVTVSGKIYDQSGTLKEQSFSLTVTAGTQTAQTANNFYRVHAPGTVYITISSITPSTITNNGFSYKTSTTCSSGNLESRLDSMGQVHNQYQQYVLEGVAAANVDLSDTVTLKSMIGSLSSSFFSSKGITPSSLNFNFGQSANLSDTAYFDPLDYSATGASILSTLRDLMINYNPSSDAAFFNSLDSLKGEALLLTDTTEIYTVGGPVAIAIASFNYWKVNGQTWLDIFEEQDSIRNLPRTAFIFETQDLLGYSMGGPMVEEKLEVVNSNSSVAETFAFKKCNVNVKSMGISDVKGAITGGYAGAAAGPGGAFAGAVLTSSVYSLSNGIGQALGCLFGWW